ncbi:MAG: flavin reductase family protein [Agathobacter rectalis]
MDRKAMYKLSYGLFILTAKEAEKDNGCIINTAIQAASEPNQLSICVNKANYTHDMIQRTGKFTVSVLSQKAQFELFKHFGFQSGRDTNKFEAFEQCARGTNGIYYITEGTNAYISVTVTKTEDLGSHTMFIGEITDMEVLSNVPSVAYAYKMKYDAIKKKAGRKNCGQVDHNTGKRSIDVIGELCGDSAKQVQRYIKMTELIPALLDKVDDGSMGFTPAVQLSYLKKKEQQEIIDAMEATQCTPSLSQAIRIKKLSEAGKLTESEAEGILGEIKQKEADRVVFKNEQLYRSHTIAVEIG